MNRPIAASAYRLGLSRIYYGDYAQLFQQTWFDDSILFLYAGILSRTEIVNKVNKLMRAL
jgi:hypothetical protein